MSEWQQPLVRRFVRFVVLCLLPASFSKRFHIWYGAVPRKLSCVNNWQLPVIKIGVPLGLLALLSWQRPARICVYSHLLYLTKAVLSVNKRHQGHERQHDSTLIALMMMAMFVPSVDSHVMRWFTSNFLVCGNCLLTAAIVLRLDDELF